MAEKVGGRRVYGTAITMSAILTLFIPVASNSSAGAAMAVRFIMGFFQVRFFEESTRNNKKLSRVLLSLPPTLFSQGGLLLQSVHLYPRSSLQVTNGRIYWVKTNILLLRSPSSDHHRLSNGSGDHFQHWMGSSVLHPSWNDDRVGYRLVSPRIRFSRAIALDQRS